MKNVIIAIKDFWEIERRNVSLDHVRARITQEIDILQLPRRPVVDYGDVVVFDKRFD